MKIFKLGLIIILITCIFTMTSCNNEQLLNVENGKFEYKDSGNIYENLDDVGNHEFYDDFEVHFENSDKVETNSSHEYNVVSSGENYLVEQELDTDKYRVTVFNENEIIFKFVFFGTEPMLDVINDDLVQIYKGTGSGSDFSIFVDTKNNLISNALTIKNPPFIVNGKILSVEKIDDKVYATFTSLFDVGAYIHKYELKDAENKNQVPDIDEAIIYDDNTILIKYFDNENNPLNRKINIDW